MLTAALIGAPLAVIPALPAQAAACLDGAVSWWADQAGSANQLFPSSSTSYKTSTRCNDINFRVGKSSFTGNVRVCWVSAGGCNSWKKHTSTTGGWMLIATDVKDNTTFRVELDFASADYGKFPAGQVAF
ncbi:hypothetical protein [Micromonospora arida]|uniref:hypothetical protein n=1 Tax=Micromonospora arida TaxID=2203715 RepID=UPI00339FF71B